MRDVERYFIKERKLLEYISSQKCDRYAKELLHDTYIECIKSEHTIKDIKKIKSWVLTIMSRQAIKYYDIQYHEVDLEYDFEYEREEIFESGYTERLLLEEIESKVTCYEYDIILLLYQGYNQKQIADKMNINHSTLRSRVEKIREKLIEYKPTHYK